MPESQKEKENQSVEFLRNTSLLWISLDTYNIFEHLEILTHLYQQMITAAVAQNIASPHILTSLSSIITRTSSSSVRTTKSSVRVEIAVTGASFSVFHSSLRFISLLVLLLLSSIVGVAVGFTHQKYFSFRRSGTLKTRLDMGKDFYILNGGFCWCWFHHVFIDQGVVQ